MDTIWGTLYAAGFAVPLFLVVASLILVYKLARKLHLRDPQAPNTWQMLAAQVGLIIFAAVLGRFVRLGFLELAALVWVPLYLLRRLKRNGARLAPNSNAANAEEPSTGDRYPAVPCLSPKETKSSVEVNRTTALRAAWFFSVSGVLLPWVVGLGVKFYLQSQGKPTLPIKGFIDPASIVVLLLLTMVMWSSPFLILAALVAVRFSFGRSPRYSFRYRLPVAWWTYGAGVVVAVVVFVPIFWQFDSMMLLFPVGILIIPPMAAVFWAGSRLTRR